MNYKRPGVAAGFTLIEVMVALFIVVMAISALMVKNMSIIDSTRYLQTKTVAHWVALNQIELARLRNRHSNSLPREELRGSEEMLGQQWFWTIKPVKTANDGFLQLQVSVAQERNDPDSIVTVMAMVDRYHQAVITQ